MKSRILKAINEGITKGLIGFDDTKFSKSSSVDNKIANILIANSIVDECIKTKSMSIELYKQIVRDAYYQVEDKELLLKLCNLTVGKIGPKCNLNWIDTSLITDMSYIFALSMFDGDISLWDVSNVIDMDSMFWSSTFNGDISGWNVSNVTIMNRMFRNSLFNGDISGWNVSNVTNMTEMFCKSCFDSDISNWDVSNVTDMGAIFNNCPIRKEYWPKFNH